MIVSLFKVAKKADQYEADLQLLQKLDKAKSQRAKSKSLALIASPQGLSAIFIAGLAKGLIKPSIARQLKSMAITFGKTNLDDWLTDQNLPKPE